MTHISAIMPTYNQAAYIEDALESVWEEVSELIVVLDGCTDGTKDIVEGFFDRKLTISHRQWAATETYAPGPDSWRMVELPENSGTAHAINAGYAHVADGNWVTWVSSDNVMVEGWGDRLLQGALKATGVVYASYYRWNSATDARSVYSVPYDPDRLLRDENCFFGPAFIIRRSLWEFVGPHRGKISHDYDHWLRVEEGCWECGYDIQHVDVPLCHYRVHDQRVTITRREQYDATYWQAEARRRRER